jgi:hypothetical protein
MTHKVVDTLYDGPRKRRVLIFQRDDGTFGFEEEYFSDLPHESAWIPVTSRRATRVSSAAEAAQEARTRVSWLVQERQA